MSLDGIVRRVTSRKKKENRYKNMKIFLNLSSNRGAEVQGHLEGERWQDQSCAPSLQSVSLSVLKSAFAVDAYCPYVRN